MKKRDLLSLILLIVLGIIFIGTLVFEFTRSSPQTKTICFPNQVCIQAEISQTPSELETGLMFRRSLPGSSGMLFIFLNNDFHSFWMKNTLIPLDMIWLDEDFTIVDIKTAEPCLKDPCQTFVPKEKALYVLEVNKGFAENNALEIGSSVIIKE